ncbi:uncharacterized protein LOC110087003 [Pogona vitticeps]
MALLPPALRTLTSQIVHATCHNIGPQQGLQQEDPRGAGCGASSIPGLPSLGLPPPPRPSPPAPAKGAPGLPAGLRKRPRPLFGPTRESAAAGGSPAGPGGRASPAPPGPARPAFREDPDSSQDSPPPPPAGESDYTSRDAVRRPSWGWGWGWGGRPAGSSGSADQRRARQLPIPPRAGGGEAVEARSSGGERSRTGAAFPGTRERGRARPSGSPLPPPPPPPGPGQSGAPAEGSRPRLEPGAAGWPEGEAGGGMKRPTGGAPTSLGGAVLGLFGRKAAAAAPRAPEREAPLPPAGAGAGAAESPPVAPAGARGASPRAEPAGAGAGEGWLECPLCLLAQPPPAFRTLPGCGHRSCRACLEEYLRLAIGESRVPVACPHCPAPLQPADLPLLLPEAGAGAAAALRDKYEEYLLRRVLVADPGTRWCPAPDCSYAVIAYGCAECPRLVCGRQGCGTEFCYHCRQPWHPDSSCKPAWEEWKQDSPVGAPERSPQPIQKEEATPDPNTIKVCPRCGAFIMKINDGSCNRMNCTVCGCLFCWLCVREITDVHFLSPSGCTFWGKKPWSRTRKLLWQLGMVLGAPMVISLVAGLAVPVITLGIPIYMGKKVLSHGRKSKLSSCQQCLSVASSIILSLFISPVVTAVTVGVGVPLMLTYIYGVVVLSLCRNRWGCGSPQRRAGEPSSMELENLAKLNELLAVLPTPTGAEMRAGAAAPTPPLPSGSRQQQEEETGQTEGGPRFGSMAVAGAGSLLREAPDTSYREGLHVVEVEVEAEPPTTFEGSLCSAVSSRSCSTDTLANTSDGGSLAGVTTE